MKTRKAQRPARPEGNAAPDSATPKTGRSSADQIFRDIVEGLYEGRYVPGQRLVESDLTQAYGVSRGSVREALNRLAAERVVSLSLNRGAQVRSLSRKEARDILVLLELLIGLAARLAAENIHLDGLRERFASVLDRLMSYETRPDSFDLVRARNAFYRTLVEIGGNEELARVLPSMHVHLVRVQFRMLRAAPAAERFSDYRSIGEAVLASDQRRAEVAGRRHVRSIARALAGVSDSTSEPA
jgi:DNA-binding GntR family transcriptional regulator